VDRQIALLNSNNIQDRPNLEMMIHLEGAVVESFYDIFLYSWHHKMVPVLPCVIDPPKERRDHQAKAADFEFQDQNPYLNDIELVKAAKAARKMLHLEKNDDDRLAKLRNDAEKEGLFGAYGGRFQAALGAIAESRRGSFSADTRDQELLKDGDGMQKGGGPAKFTDVVMKAMEARRKGFGTARNEEGSSGPQTDSADLHPEQENVKPNIPNLRIAPDAKPSQVNGHASTEGEPSLVNWNQSGDALEELHREMADLDSPARARYNADSARAFAAESQYRESLGESEAGRSTEHPPQFLPSLDLPGSSLQTPAASAAPSVHSQTSTHGQDQNNELLKRTDLNGLQPPTQGEHSLSPVRSERTSAVHPNMSTSSLEQANDASTSKDDFHGTHGNGVSSSAVPMRFRDYAASESASADTTPALAYSQHSNITDPSSKGPATPPAISTVPAMAANGPVPSTAASTEAAAKAGPQASTTKDLNAVQGSSTRQLFSHILDPSGKTLTSFKFSSFAERRNMNISTGSSSAGSKPPPKKNWVEGCMYMPSCTGNMR
jgi:hypothetical protein